LELVVDKHKNIEVISGKKNLEVRPSGTNKGELVRKIVQQASPDFIFCAGDDRTDEDMFKTLTLIVGGSGEGSTEGSSKRSTSVTTCVIGPANKRSSASTRLESPADLILTLESLAAIV
jgi:trehalose-phosphatase